MGLVQDGEEPYPYVDPATGDKYYHNFVVTPNGEIYRTRKTTRDNKPIQVTLEMVSETLGTRPCRKVHRRFYFDLPTDSKKIAEPFDI